MSERCIVRIKFTPAATGSEVRRAVGGFLRYVQHRDLHPDSKLARPNPQVAGPGVPYFLAADGLTDAEFWQVANSLR